MEKRDPKFWCQNAFECHMQCCNWYFKCNQIYSSGALSQISLQRILPKFLTWHLGKLIHHPQTIPTNCDMLDSWQKLCMTPTCVQRISKQSIKAKLPTCIVLVKYSGKGITLNLVVKNVVKDVDFGLPSSFSSLENPTQIMSGIQSTLKRFRWVKNPSFFCPSFSGSIHQNESRSKFLRGFTG